MWVCFPPHQAMSAIFESFRPISEVCHFTPCQVANWNGIQIQLNATTQKQIRINMFTFRRRQCNITRKCFHDIADVGICKIWYRLNHNIKNPVLNNKDHETGAFDPVNRQCHCCWLMSACKHSSLTELIIPAVVDYHLRLRPNYEWWWFVTVTSRHWDTSLLCLGQEIKLCITAKQQELDRPNNRTGGSHFLKVPTCLGLGNLILD